VRDEPRRPLPAVLQPIQYRNTVDTCVTKKTVKYVKRHGKRVRVNH